MKTVKIKLSNVSSKHTQYHCNGGVASLSVGVTKELTANVGATLYFENDNSMKYVISESDNGRTFTYNH